MKKPIFSFPIAKSYFFSTDTNNPNISNFLTAANVNITFYLECQMILTSSEWRCSIYACTSSVLPTPQLIFRRVNHFFRLLQLYHCYSAASFFHIRIKIFLFFVISLCLWDVSLCFGNFLYFRIRLCSSQFKVEVLTSKEKLLI